MSKALQHVVSQCIGCHLQNQEERKPIHQHVKNISLGLGSCIRPLKSAKITIARKTYESDSYALEQFLQNSPHLLCLLTFRVHIEMKMRIC